MGSSVMLGDRFLVARGESLHICFVASRDPRERYRFVLEPLSEVHMQVRVYRDDSNLFKSVSRAMTGLRCCPECDFVVLTGTDLRNLAWFLLIRVFSNARVVIRIGGDPVAVRRSAQRGMFSAKKVLAYMRSRAGIMASRFMLRHAEGVIVVSAFLAESVKPLLGRKTRTYVSPPVLLSDPQGDRNYRQSGESFTVLMVANLNYAEKADGVLRVARGLAKACEADAAINIHFEVVGGGRSLSQVRAEIDGMRLPANLCITVHGYQTEVSDFYRRADVFAYNSTLDSFPLVLLEAASHGLPIVLNRWGPFPDIFEEDTEARFVGTTDEEGFGLVILDLARDIDKRESVGRAAHARYMGTQSREARGTGLKSFFEGFGR